MEIRSLATPSVAPRSTAVSAAEASMPVTSQEPQAEAGPASLSPPVTLDISAQSTREARFSRDADTNQLVMSVVDAGSGEVVIQLPSKVALRAQAYANELAARNAQKPSLARLA